MTPTVPRQLRKIQVTPENLTTWTAIELLPLLNQMRQGLNYVARQQASWSTTGDGLFHTIWTSDDLAVNTAVRFTVDAIGFEAGDQSSVSLAYLFFNDGVVHLDSNTTFVNLNSAGYGYQFVIVGNHVEFQVSDVGSPVNFTAIIDAIVQVGP